MQYGPCFQGIDKVWINGAQAIAQVKTPADIEQGLDSYQLHPCYLDSCFQVLVGLLKKDLQQTEAAAMIPVSIGRLLTYKQSEVSWFKANITRQSPRSVLADFELYDEQGNLVALAVDCRFRSVNFGQAAHETSIYEYISLLKANPYSNTAGKALSIKELAEVAESSLSSGNQLERRQRLYSEITPLLDTLIACYAHETLSQYSSSGKLSFDAIFSSQGIEPRQQYLISRLLQILQEQGWATNTDSSWQLVNSDQIPDSHSVWLTLLGDYPGLMPEVLSAGRVGPNLSEILTGELDAETILNPGSSSGLKDHLADTALSMQGTLNSALKVVDQWLEGRGNNHFRVLHLSGGQGRLCSRLIGKLPENSDYLYVHASADLCAKVGAQLEYFPQARIENIDFDSQEAWQDFLTSENQFDLIIVNDALHHNTQPDRLLQSLQSISASDGLLLCIEKSPSRLADITQGIDDDWWHRTTEIDDPVSLLLPADEWNELVSEAGFADIEVIHDDPNQQTGAYLVLARNPQTSETETQNENWLIVSSQDESSRQLASELAAAIPTDVQVTNLQHIAGQTSIDIDEENQISLDLLDKDAIEASPVELNFAQYDKCILAAGLSGTNSLEDSLDLRTLEDSLDLRTIVTLNLVQCFEQMPEEERPGVFLVTSGGNTSTHNGTSSLAGTALWGLGRVIRNEHPTLGCHQIDLQAAIDQVAESLMTEILHPTEDFEVILSVSIDGKGKAKKAQSQRHVLQMQPGRLAASSKDLWAGNIKLDFSDPGLLKNLQWVPLEEQKPGAEQIAVKPKASGLNFRDLMYAMGLLSDEAVESGLSGPTLGIEFAGEVVSVGSEVSDFNIGDSVMGFGPACFSTELITNASAVAPMPKSWLYEEAATVPTTFFTAYYALDHLARLQPGESVLIHGGAGGVGIAAIQLAHYLGAEVFVTVGTDEKRDFVGFMGADHILDSRSLNFADDIMELTHGEGIDVVLNSLAGEAINKNLRILRPFGRFLELGKRDFYENSRIGLKPFRNNISYFGIDADQLMMEKPQLASRLFKDLMKIFEEGAIRPLPYRCFNASRAEEAFRYMQQARHIGKILLTFDDLPEVSLPRQDEAEPLQLDAEACYLVTGGLGGFGLETTKWLAAKGAKHLVLLSRSGEPSESSSESYSELAEMDVALSPRAIDVTDRTALDALFGEFGNNLPPLKGLVHAATVFADGLLRNMDAEKMRKVLDPKVIGGWNLHQLTKNLALDFFVVYSSVTTFFGNPGQGNYVAANSALEGLVRLRQNAGLPATFAAWGPISDAGFLARNEDIKDALQSRLDGSSLTSEEALDMLEKLIGSKHQGAAVVDINWGPMKRFLPIAESNQYRILNWIAANQGGDEDLGEDIRELLEGLSPEDAMVKVADLLSREVSQILHIPADKLDQQVSVFDLGMDSLMGVELAMAVEKCFNVNMSAMALSEGPSIMRLSERIIQKLMGPEVEAPVSDDSVKRLAAVHNEDISESDLEELSNKVQADKSGNIL